MFLILIEGLFRQGGIGGWDGYVWLYGWMVLNRQCDVGWDAWDGSSR